MKANAGMRTLLQKYAIEWNGAVRPCNQYCIWQKTDAAGRPYWGVSAFWKLDRCSVPAQQNLSWLEWDGNEVYLSAKTDKQIAPMLRKAIGIMQSWKNQMEKKYPKTAFCLFASYDNGDLLEPEEGEWPIQSVTLRFWADRGDDSVIDLTDFENMRQPALLMVVGKADQQKGMTGCSNAYCSK